MENICLMKEQVLTITGEKFQMSNNRHAMDKKNITAKLKKNNN